MENEPQAWDGLYQQRPVSRGGGQFKDDKWLYVDAAPEGLSKVRWWDLASTEGGGDWTVGMLLGANPEGLLYVMDVVRRRLSASGVEDLVYATAVHDGTSVPVRIEQERAGSGKALVDGYSRRLNGWDVDGVRPEGDKETRAAPVAAQQQRSRVLIVRAEWNKELVKECGSFPRGKHDDQVDCLSGGHGFLAIAGPSAMGEQILSESPIAKLYDSGAEGPVGGSVGTLQAAHSRAFGR
jgi:predicted phage terminase large subunit-like protein